MQEAAKFWTKKKTIKEKQKRRNTFFKEKQKAGKMKE